MKTDIFNRNFKNGFTIIELLVVVAIATLILSFVFVSVREAKARSRDARREQDIKQLQNSLGIYHINRRQFPVCSLGAINSSSDCLSLAIFADNVANVLSLDPLGGGTGECLAAGVFVYCYESNGNDYTLHYNLETNSIPGKSTGWQKIGP